MLLSKRRGTKLIAATIISVVAFASFWSACSDCTLLVHGSEMKTPAHSSAAPCPDHIVRSHPANEWDESTDACFDIAWDRTEATQFANPPPTRLAAMLPSGYDDDLEPSWTRLASAARFYTPLPSPAVPRTLLALKTLLRV